MIEITKVDNYVKMLFKPIKMADRRRMWFSTQKAGESICSDHKTDFITEQ